MTNPFNGTPIDTMYNQCLGPYENAAPGGDGPTTNEVGDAPCYFAGDTHPPLLNSQPDEATGCTDGYYQNGDLDFDGNPYWPDWPVSVAPTDRFPGSFVQALPVTGGGQQYQSLFLQTDVALSESTCAASPDGCAVPPPNAPGRFYPYWSLGQSGGAGGQSVTTSGSGNSGGGCVIEFGNVHQGVNDFGRDAQYGTNQQAVYGYPEFIGPIMPNNCGGGGQGGSQQG